MTLVDKILTHTGYTEASTFTELLNGLGDDCPDDKAGYASLFRCIEMAEQDGYLTIERERGRISSLQLTEEGAAYVRDMADASRPLLNL